MGFPDSSVGKESTCNAGDPGSIPGSGISGGEGIGYPLQYSGLGNSMDCIFHGVAKRRTRLSTFHLQGVAGAHHLIGWRPDGNEGLTLPKRIPPVASAGASAPPVSTAASNRHTQAGTDDFMRYFLIRILFICILLILFLWSPLKNAELVSGVWIFILPRTGVLLRRERSWRSTVLSSLPLRPSRPCSLSPPLVLRLGTCWRPCLLTVPFRVLTLSSSCVLRNLPFHLLLHQLSSPSSNMLLISFSVFSDYMSFSRSCYLVLFQICLPLSSWHLAVWFPALSYLRTPSTPVIFPSCPSSWSEGSASLWFAVCT